VDESGKMEVLFNCIKMNFKVDKVDLNRLKLI